MTFVFYPSYDKPMPRPIRLEFSGAWYHVIHRGTKTPKLFKKESHFTLFLECLAETLSLEGIECHAYALLDHEVHLLIRTPHANLSASMRHLFSVYAQRYNLDTKHDGPLFKDRFKAIVIDPDEYLLPVSHYIHTLPILKRKAVTPQDYTHSSCRIYTGVESKPAWLQTSTILRHFPQPFEQQYAHYLQALDNTDLYKVYKRKKISPFLGSKSFILAVKNSAASEQTSGPKKSPPSMDILIKSTASVFDKKAADIMISKRGRGNKQLGRTVAMYLCRHVGHYSIKDIAKTFGVTHESAVSVRLARFKTYLQNNPDVQSKLKLLTQTAGRFSL